MEVKFFCPQWGSKHLDFAIFLEKVKRAGYDGVEMSLPLNTAEKKEILNLLKGYDLLLVAQHWETQNSDFKVHKEEYRIRLVNLATAVPLFINSQTGKDYFSFAQNAELISVAEEISRMYGIKIIHETHRGKFSFAAHVIAEYLKKIPALRLTLDLSHWCNIAESFLEDQQEAVNLALSRTEHIHARVGFPEGPQIPDPRVPEWKEALLIHESWWKKVINLKKEAGQQFFTITPEFGPYPYMTILPFTQQPVTDQWEVNVYMMNHLKSVFKK
jgi:sugar phosphate isomerase/epimerase